MYKAGANMGFLNKVWLAPEFKAELKFMTDSSPLGIKKHQSFMEIKKQPISLNQDLWLKLKFMNDSESHRHFCMEIEK